MFECLFLEKEIKERLSELKGIDSYMHDYLLNKMIEFDRFKVFKRTIEQTIKRYLVRIAGFQKAKLREYPKKIMEEYRKRLTVKNLVERINQSSSRKKILYVTYSPTFNIVRQSIHLRKKGYETILLMEGNLSLINFYEKYFDVVYVVNSIYTLYYIFKEANPYLIHVQGTTRRSNHLGILAKFLSKSKVVFNFYDIPSTTIAEEDIKFVWDKEGVELDLFSEKIACERCDGFIFSYSPEAGEILKSRYRISSPMLQLDSYTCEEFMPDDYGKYSDTDGKVHLVYGGHVSPSNMPKRFVGDTQFHSIIEKLIRHGICFDIYILDVRWRKIRREYADYIRMSDNNPRFKFDMGVLLDKATAEFSKYDFGAMIYPFEEAFDKGTRILEEHVRMRLPDKFFTYIEAGLPIIISEELRSGARLVREYEMGIVVSQKDLEDLHKIIESYDREKLRTIVKKAREELSMKRQIGRLIDFYEKVVADK